MASNYLKDWRRKRARTGDFLDEFASDEEVSLEDTQEEGGASHSLQPPDETVGSTSIEAQHLEDTQEGGQSQLHPLDETLEGSSYDLSMGEEPDAQGDYGYSEYPDTSDEEMELVDFESQTEEQQSSLREDMAAWAADTKQTHMSVNKMLAILRKHGHNLPKDHRTLMHTPSVVESKKKCNGDYIYYGLESGIRKYLEQCPTFSGAVKLDINIDGVPLFKSSQTQFWPIMAKFDKSEPFIVSLFCGTAKPDPIEDYLQDFVTELLDLQEKGIDHEGIRFDVMINAFICDAPARAFVKCIKGHNAYEACERCEALASHVNGRMVYTNHAPCEKRTDEGFKTLQYTGHQKKATPLIATGVGCVSQFVLDYMHVVCLGAVKRLLTFMIKGPAECKLPKRSIEELSSRLISLRGKMPSEFARQPRSVVELDRWKATEFRQFLLYTGPIVLKDLLSDDQYHHFLCLTVGMSMLLESDLQQREFYLDYARNLIKFFVENSAEYYGNTFCVYNIHSLLHLFDDVKRFKCSLNDISAFPFENHLQSIKRMVRNGRNPIAQVTKKLVEMEQSKPTHSRSHNRYYVSAKTRDGCFLLEDKIAFVRENRADGKLLADVVTLNDANDLFEKPCESKLINILYVDSRMDQAHRRLVDKRELKRKAVCIPHSEGFAIFPLLHSMD